MLCLRPRTHDDPAKYTSSRERDEYRALDHTAILCKELFRLLSTVLRRYTTHVECFAHFLQESIFGRNARYVCGEVQRGRCQPCVYAGDVFVIAYDMNSAVEIWWWLEFNLPCIPRHSVWIPRRYFVCVCRCVFALLWCALDVLMKGRNGRNNQSGRKRCPFPKSNSLLMFARLKIKIREVILPRDMSPLSEDAHCRISASAFGD